MAMLTEFTSRNICGLDYDLMVEVGEMVKQKREREKFNKTISYIKHMRETMVEREGVCLDRDIAKWELEWTNKWGDGVIGATNIYYGTRKFADFIGYYETDTYEGRELFTDLPYSETYY
tara:strand:+ start:262 stop:618 length:357 start_codon:yes stop_codon:yes gene_type:complete